MRIQAWRRAESARTSAQRPRYRRRRSKAFGRNLCRLSSWFGVPAGGAHTPEMVPFEVVNPRKPSLADRAAKVLVGRLHVGPSGRRKIRGNKSEDRVWGEEERRWYWYFCR